MGRQDGQGDILILPQRHVKLTQNGTICTFCVFLFPFLTKKPIWSKICSAENVPKTGDMKNLDKVKESILDSAAYFFDRFGYEKTSVDEIARRAHKAKASVYYHFSGKLQLFRTVLEQEMERVRTGLNEIKSKYGTITTDEVKEYFMTRIRLMREAKVYRRYVLSSYMYGRNEVSEIVDEVRKSLDDEEYAYYVSLCKAGKEEGIFPEAVSPEVFGNMMLLVLKGIEIQFFDTDDIREMENTYRAMLEVLMFKLYNNN